MSELNELDVLIAEYIAREDETEALSDMQNACKDRMRELLPPYEPERKISHESDAGKVAWVKGRTSVKINEKVLRQRLVLSGVPLSVLDEAFDAATATTVGAPYLQVVRKKEK